MTKPVKISYSSHSRFKQCSEKYWLAKEYETTTIASPLIFGKSIENSIEVLLARTHSLIEALDMFELEWTKDKLDNLNIDYLASDIEECIILKQFEDEFKLPSTWKETYKSNEVLYNKIAWICCLIRGKVLIKAFYDKILPKMKLHVKDNKLCSQLEVDLSNEEGDKLVGFLDFVIEYEDHPGLMIVDLKTSGKRYTDSQLDDSEQLKAYIADKGAMFNTRTAGYLVLVKKLIKVRTCDMCGIEAKNFQTRNCPNCKQGKFVISDFDGDVQFIYKDFTEEELQEQLDDYATSVLSIKSGIRNKNKESCFSFGRTCEFYSICWENKKVEEVKHLKKKEEKNALTESIPVDKVIK